MDERLKDRTAIITGAGSGIGRGMAQVFAKAGARVLVVDLKQEAADAVVKEITEANGQAAAFAADVSRWSDTQAMAKAAMDQFGRIDVLCANAGIYPVARIDEMTEEQWDQMQAINLKGAFFCVKACLPHMRQQGKGRIVLTSSVTGPITGLPGLSHYGASKAGMLGFMRSAALEFAREGITINAVLPGIIRTPGLAGLGEEEIARMARTIPVGKLGEPEDIAHAALFFASDEAKYITGQTIVVDGGQLLPETASAFEE